MSKKQHAALKAERKKFDAWAKERSQQGPGDWVLTGGCEGEEKWAWEGWKARAAEATPKPPPAPTPKPPTVADVLAMVEAYADVIGAHACWTGTAAAYEADEAEARQKMEAAVRALAGEGASS